MNLKKYINFTYIRLIIYAISFYYFYKKYIKKDKDNKNENTLFKYPVFLILLGGLLYFLIFFNNNII